MTTADWFGNSLVVHRVGKTSSDLLAREESISSIVTAIRNPSTRSAKHSTRSTSSHSGSLAGTIRSTSKQSFNSEASKLRQTYNAEALKNPRSHSKRAPQVAAQPRLQDRSRGGKRSTSGIRATGLTTKEKNFRSNVHLPSPRTTPYVFRSEEALYGKYVGKQDFEYTSWKWTEYYETKTIVDAGMGLDEMKLSDDTGSHENEHELA